MNENANNTEMSIKERIRELFDEKIVTPYYVAKNTKISEPTLCRILNGKTIKPGSATIDELAKYFNVNPTWILTGKGPKIQHAISEPPAAVYDKKHPLPPLSEEEKNRVIKLIEKLIEKSERNNRTLENLAEIEAQNSKNLAKLINQLTQDNT